MIEIENADNRDFMIHHHLGTGDHFICNGLVNYICSEIEKETEKCLQSSPVVYLSCKKRNIKTVSYLYSENKMVIPIEIGDNEIGCVNSFVEQNNLKESFYKQFDIPYNFRYEYFRLPKTKFPKMLQTPNERFILIHDTCSDAKYNLDIETSLTKVYFESNEPLFAHMDLIKKAWEIHCIDSSIYHLIENMRNDLSSGLFFHNARQTSAPCKVSKKWTVV